MTPRHVAVVPHTHWDREWYEPFQTFRMKLVDTVDSLVRILESDPSYRHFVLDGQMAVVDDYLEVRPEAEERIRALASAGRLSVGPWYALMDEFLVSGETIVRDLQMGLRRGTAFGGAMDVGYLPDMFGHVAQMPQILRLAGLAHAVVWRGVPSSVTASAFWWEAPDGSTVRAEYLPQGYGNGASLSRDAVGVVRRAAECEREVGTYLLGTILLMNGSDHLAPQPWLGRVVAEANASQDDYVFAITSLEEYLADAPTEDLPHHVGELRSGARANMLMGVTSNRVDVKRAAAATERALERRAEPFAALFQPAEQWPARLLDLAWRNVVRNAAHDSVCACSADEVVDAVLGRYAEARQVADGVAHRALDALARSLSDAGPVVVNPSARRRSGVVELTLAGSLPPGPHVQVVERRSELPGEVVLDVATVRSILAMLAGPKIDDHTWVHDVKIEEDATGIDLTVTIGAEERPGVPFAEAKAELQARVGARPDAVVRLHLLQPPIQRVLVRSAEVTGFGWRPWEPAELTHPANGRTVDGAVVLANGLVTVAVDPADATFSVDGIGGFGRLVDGGDLGDSYNYSPPAGDTTLTHPESVTVTLAETGPVRATAHVTATYRWPDHIDPASQTRVGDHRVEVTSTIELRAEERVVRVTTSFVNPCRDHRLRVHLPLPEPATSSEAECAFGTVQRGLTAEGRDEERGLPTFPARRFVAADGLTVVHDGVTEYELTDLEPAANADSPQAGTLALTVLRSTGMLSRLGMAYRPLPAGPLTPVEGLQMVGRRVRFSYAVAIGQVDPWALTDDVLLPLEVVTAPGGGWRPARGHALAVEGAEVSAVRREAGALEVRVFNPGAAPSLVRLAERAGWLVDLRGGALAPFDGQFGLRPHGIATLRLADA